MKTFILLFGLILAFTFQFNFEGKAQTKQYFENIEIAASGADTALVITKVGDIFYWSTQVATSGESVAIDIQKTIDGTNYVAYKSDTTATSAIISELPGYFDKQLRYIVRNLGSAEATVNVSTAFRKKED